MRTLLNVVCLVVLASLTACNYYENKGVFTGPRSPKDTFETINRDLFVPYCVRCHQGEEPAGGLDMRDYSSLMDTGVIHPGKPDDSMVLDLIFDESMPPRGPKPPPDLVKRLLAWIEAGAPEK